MGEKIKVHDNMTFLKFVENQVFEIIRKFFIFSVVFFRPVPIEIRPKKQNFLEQCTNINSFVRKKTSMKNTKIYSSVFCLAFLFFIVGCQKEHEKDNSKSQPKSNYIIVSDNIM